MTIHDAPPAVSLRERAARAWAEQLADQQAAERERRLEQIQRYREGLQGAIESTLRVAVPLDAIQCPLTVDEVDYGVRDGDALASTVIDGLMLILQRRGGSRCLALEWVCPTCGTEPITDTTIRNLEELGALLAHLPTLCGCASNDGAGCQHCGVAHGVSVPCGDRRAEP